MNSLLFVAMLALGADQGKADAKADAPKLDGKWLIVYAEEGGKRNNAWEQRPAKVDGTNLTYQEEGKDRSIQLTFGPHQTVKAAFAGGAKKDGEDKKDTASPHGAYQGVYIASLDYLCLSLDPEGKDGGEKARGTSSAAFILILRRQR